LRSFGAFEKFFIPMNFLSFFSIICAIVSLSTFNPQTAVYFIMLFFISSGIIFYVLSSVFLSMMLFVVYVGAIAILFLFTVMLMQSTHQYSFSTSLTKYYVFPFFLIFSFFATYILFRDFFFFFDSPEFSFFSPYDLESNFLFYSKDTMFLYSFYSFFSYYLVLLGVILFIITLAVTLLVHLLFFVLSIMTYIDLHIFNFIALPLVHSNYLTLTDGQEYALIILAIASLCSGVFVVSFATVPPSDWEKRKKKEEERLKRRLLRAQRRFEKYGTPIPDPREIDPETKLYKAYWELSPKELADPKFFIPATIIASTPWIIFIAIRTYKGWW
jgi:NADH:ubiquinone oxidoreductase subunit 6 (subunit J)